MTEQEQQQMQQQAQQQLLLLKARLFDSEEMIKQQQEQLNAMNNYLAQVAQAFNVPVDNEKGIDIEQLSQALSNAAQAMQPTEQEQEQDKEFECIEQ